MRIFYAILLSLILVIGSGLAITTIFNPWFVVRSLLSYKLETNQIYLESANGDLLKGLELNRLKVSDALILDTQGNIFLEKVKIQIVWSRAYPSLFIQANEIRLAVDGVVNSATIGELAFKSNQLSLYEVHVEGSPSELILSDSELKKSTILPSGSSVQIQEIKMSTPFDWRNITSIQGGKLQTQQSEAIIFYGTQVDEKLDLSLYSKSVEIEQLISKIKALTGVSAYLEDVDISITGSFDEQIIKGSLSLSGLHYRRLHSVMPAKVDLDLKFNQVDKKNQLYGQVILGAGEVKHKNTILKLKPSKIVFKGNPESPELDIKFISKIDNALIRVEIKGTTDKPDLTLTSSPPYPEQKILIMLLTGKEWSGTEKSIHDGKLSADSAKEFVDYFIFGGRGDVLARKFGIKEISLQNDESVKGVGVKKTLSDNVAVGYGIAKKIDQTETGAVIQKIGVDYKIFTDTVVSVEGELESKGKEQDLSAQDSTSNARFGMQVKRSF